MNLPRRLDEAGARHELPHPLAVLCDRLRTHDDASRLAAALVFAEGVARYLALALLADAAARGTSPAVIARYANARGFGSALGTIEHFHNATRRAPDRLFPELDALIGGPWWQSLDRLKALRNDASHARVNLAAEATSLLRRHDDDLRTLIDGCAFLQAYPLGILRGVRIGTDGRPSGRWQSCRGPTPRGAVVELHDASGIPSDQLLLVDTLHGRALSVAPFFCLVEDDFYWLDLPAPGDAPRSPYRSPVPGTPARDSLPSGVHDPSGRHPQGLPFDRWLTDRAAWPCYADLSTRPEVVAQIVASSQATRFDLAEHLPTREMPAPLPVATTRRASRRVLIGVLGAAAMLVIVVLVFTGVDRSAARAGAEAASSSVPALTPLADPLKTRLQDWYDAVLTQGSEHGRALEPFYAPLVRFRASGSVLRNVDWITSYWNTLLSYNNATFDVDWSESRSRSEALDPRMLEQAACLQLAGASGDVVLARLHATEDDPTRPIRAPDVPCARIEGVYLVRLREVAGTGLVICHEGWSTPDGICAPGSCPQARVCRRR